MLLSLGSNVCAVEEELASGCRCAGSGVLGIGILCVAACLPVS